MAGSGERKSSAINAATSSIKEFDRKERRLAEAAHQEYSVKTKIWEKSEKRRLEEFYSSTNKENPKGLEVESNEEARRPPSPKKPEKPLFFNLLQENLTPEALYEILDRNIPSILIRSAEGGLVFRSPLFKKNPQILASAWSGEDIGNSRATRKPKKDIYIEDPKLSLLIGVQKEIFFDSFRNNVSLMQNGGLLARMLICESEAKRGYRTAGPPPPTDAAEKFHERISQILSTDRALLKNPYEIEFEPWAASAIQRYYWDTEQGQLPGGPCFEIPEAASRTAEIACRLAAVFQFFEHGPSPVSSKNAERGVDFAKWYLTEHLRLFGPQPTAPQAWKDAELLLPWLKEQAGKISSDRILYNKVLNAGPIKSRRKLRADPALNELVACGMVMVFMDNKTWYVQVTPHGWMNDYVSRPMMETWPTSPPGQLEAIPSRV